MGRIPRSRKALLIVLVLLISLSLLKLSGLFSQTLPVTTVDVGNEPRGLAINTYTNKVVVTNHNTNTVTVADLTEQTITNVRVGNHPYGVAINTFTNKAYIANEKSDSVSVLNLWNNTISATIAVGGDPQEIAVSPGTSQAIVANSKTDNVSILNLTDNTVSATVAVGVAPRGVVINTTNNEAFISNFGSNTVSVINLSTKAVIATLTVGAGPAGMDIQTATRRIVVVNHLSNTVSVIDGSNNTLLATLPVGLAPSDVAINTSTNRAYVTNADSDSVSVIDLSTNTVIATYPVGPNPEGIAVVPPQNVLLVVNKRGDNVYVIDLASPPTGMVAPVGRDPEGVAIDPDNNTAITANSKSNDLSAVDLATGNLLSTMPVGRGPQAVAIHPISKRLVDVNYRDNTASIIDLPSRTVLATVAVGKGPISVAIDSILNLAAVANERDGTISLIDLSSNTVTATIPAGSHPKSIDVNPGTHIAAVANKKIDKVTLIDIVNRVTVATIAVGKDPISVAINPQTNVAVVANMKSDTVSMIDLQTHAVTATAAVLATPTGVAINPSTNMAAVVSHEKMSLQLIDLSTNTISSTLSSIGTDPDQVAINPYTNIAAVTSEDPGVVVIVQLPNPIPVISSLSPTSIAAGGSGFTLTVNGNKFIKTSTVKFGSQTLTPQFISNSQLQVAVPASALTQAGAVQVSVSNPTPGGGTSNSQTFTLTNPNNPIPSVSTISPTFVLAGATGLTLTVNGSNFIGSASVSFNGQALTTTYVSSTQVTAAVPASAVATAGTYSVIVANPAPGGGASNTATFTVNNPVPTTSALSPNSTLAGSGATSLTVTGTNFVSGAAVQFNGTALTTSFISATQLTATIPATLLTAAGTASVTIVNSAPGGGTSNAQTFTINNPVPALTALSPTSVIAGSAGFTLTLTGSHFVSPSTVSFNGRTLTTSYVSETQLTALVPAAAIATAGVDAVVVTNPAPGGGASNAAFFMITNPVPTIGTLSPALVVTGSGPLSLTVNGTGFVSTSTILLDGQPLSTQFVSPTQLAATVPASVTAISHAAEVTVTNSPPGGGNSITASLIVNTPPVADAGRALSATVGKAASLDGRRSGDADSDRIAFSWSLLSAPSGSAAALGNLTSIRPTFTPDLPGSYQIQLIVNDGNAESTPATVAVAAFAANAPPNADAGFDQTAVVGQTVVLDGRRSFDPDDDRITYRWTFSSAPDGSSAALADPASVLPSFVPDIPGVYVAQLVVNDGAADSAPVRISIHASSADAGPMARAGRDQNVLTGAPVSLDGSGSRDPNGDPLTYRWFFVSAPAGSAAALNSATTGAPVFTPDLGGEYLVRLVVNDGTTDSPSDTILIVAAAPNPGPNAVAGSDRIVYQTATVFLDGSASFDPNGDPLTYSWWMISAPAGSQADLSDADSAHPSFVADADGPYVILLTVSDGVDRSFGDLIVVRTRALLSLAVTPANRTAAPGQSQHFTAIGTFSDRTTKDLTNIVSWSSSNSTVAAIGPSGIATAIQGGSTLIQASYGSIVSPSQTFTVKNPAPVLTRLSPNTLQEGSAGLVLTLTGANFLDGASVNFAGSPLATSFISATQLTAPLPAALIASAGVYPVTVTNPLPGGGTSNTLPFTATHPAPSISAIAPALVATGSGSFTLTIDGADFVSGASILIDDQTVVPTSVTPNRLTATAPAEVAAASHAAQVSVINPGPGGGASNTATLTVDSPPVADAGSSRSATVGTSVSLDGRRSSDAEGDPIAYFWRLLSAPAGSAASLVDPTGVQPGLTADLAGSYQIQLIVNDGKMESAPAIVTVTAFTLNAPPNADAGSDLTAAAGRLVTLDGRRSSDPDNDRISFRWRLLSAPAGSGATLADAASVVPSFTPDLPGSYQVELIVNDGAGDSAPVQVTVLAAAANAAPIATAGRDRNALTGDPLSLDGSQSRDPDGDPLSYRWNIVSQPAGSAAALFGATGATPSLTPDVGGIYVVRLIVNDGASDSAPDTVLIAASAPNPAPNAAAGSDQAVYQTDTVTLDGSGSSDPNGDPVSYQWSIVSAPSGSQAVLSDPAAARPTFVADLDGTYLIRLVVNDGAGSGAPDLVVVKARPLVSIAVAPVNP